MSYYLEPYSHIKNKIKVELELSNYATKKYLEHATGVGTSDLAARKILSALNAEADKLDINKLFNISTILDNLKTKVNDLDVDSLKNVVIDLKKVSDVVDTFVEKISVQQTKYKGK